jgi:hypothetical protein
MLGMKSYTKQYVAACKAKVDADLKAIKAAKLDPATESRMLVNLTLALDHMFVHRLTGAEGKDGNALVEVRVLVNSVEFNGGKLQVDKLPGWPMSAVSGLKLPPETSILGLKPGDAVRLDVAGFGKLAKAFFQQIEEKFS